MSVSLRNRIYLLMIGLILASFVLIGAVTLIFFQNENAKYHAERLLRKERTVLKSINYFLEKNKEDEIYPFYTKEFAEKIVEVSRINNFEINVFDLEGQLITSTYMDYFEKGILSEQVDTSFLSRLSRSDTTILVSQKKEDQAYLSTFSYLDNGKGEHIAIVNLPYFSKEALNKEEVEVFFASLLQIYVILLIIAVLIAYFLSSNITKSLRVIGERMRSADISKEYEAIPWKSKDEVGELVEQYNKMMLQLKDSADKLARSERESAWREMAKQVAHEIKNPLTPMKLSVQQLERAWNDGTEDLGERMARFTKSMVHQIDSLSNIASEFSNFAQMPRAEREVFDLAELVKEHVILFNEGNIQVELEENNNYEIYADKAQIGRVLTNLFKNAFQAIPKDREAAVSVHLTEEIEHIKLIVQDNGSGIPAEQIDQIFLPNFTTKTHGMGLGLAMVKTILEYSGGKINFETELDQGTSFIISLPKNKT